MELTFVSQNSNKLKEFQYLLNIKDLQVSRIRTDEIQSDNLEEIVRMKIKAAKELLPNTPFFVEHSGVEIDGWNQLPGGLTGVFLEKVGPAGICKMLEAFEDHDRHASAISMIGFYHNGSTKIFKGQTFGRIADHPRSSLDQEWLFDKIFIPDDAQNDETYSEMGFIRKCQISMRKKAVDEFSRFLQKHTDLDFFPKLKLDSEVIDTLRNQIRRDELPIAFQGLQSALKGSWEQKHLLTIEADFNRLSRDTTNGTITAEHRTIRHNNIVLSLLGLINRVA